MTLERVPVEARPLRGLLAVDGIDGSGKSVLARRLLQATAAADVGAVTLSVDDFRRPVDFAGQGRAEADVYYDDYYDLAALDRSVRAFLEGQPGVTLPVFDAVAHRLNGERWIPFDPTTTLLVVEGVFALRVPVLAERAAVLYLRTSFAAAGHRVETRDTARGRSAEDVRHRIAARYFPAQERYLRECNPVQRAHVVVDHEELGAPVVVRFDTVAVRGRLPAPRAGTDLAAVVQQALGCFATSASLG